MKLPQGKWMYHWQSLFFFPECPWWCCSICGGTGWLSNFIARSQLRRTFVIITANSLIISYVTSHILILFCLLHTTPNHACPASLGQSVECIGINLCKYHQNLDLCCGLLSINYFFFFEAKFTLKSIQWILLGCRRQGIYLN